MKKKITFDALMNCVRYFASMKKTPYCLTLDGEGHFFKDTVDIVPFVRSIGWTVEGVEFMQPCRGARR